MQNPANLKEKRYTIDTTTAIRLNSYYRDNPWFAPIWDRIATLFKNKRILIPEIIYEEIAKNENNLILKYIDKDIHVIKPDKEQQQHFANIVNTFKNWINPNSTKNQGDVWLVALAMVEHLTVVTEESSNLNRLKIPKVCYHYNIPYLNTNQFLTEIYYIS